jgi:predicted nucleic acid-binding Zn ribbon protein
MERRKTENLTDVLMRFLRQEGLETPLNEHRLIELWEEVAGPTVAKYTLGKRIYNQVLYVQITSAIVRAELQMRRTFYVNELNRRVGSTVITDIHFQ